MAVPALMHPILDAMIIPIVMTRLVFSGRTFRENRRYQILDAILSLFNFSLLLVLVALGCMGDYETCQAKYSNFIAWNATDRVSTGQQILLAIIGIFPSLIEVRISRRQQSARPTDTALTSICD